MPSVNIKLKGLKELKAGMKKAPSFIGKEINQGIATSIIELERKARQEAPVDTGNLRSKHRTKLDPLRMRGELLNVAKYATAVHEGTRARVIRPKKKKALSWKGAAHPVKKINHPGTQANPWLERTADKKRAKIERIMQKSINRALKQI